MTPRIIKLSPNSVLSIAPKGIITVLRRTLKSKCGINTKPDFVRIKHPGEWQKILRSHFAGSANNLPSSINFFNNIPSSSRSSEASIGIISAGIFWQVSLSVIAVSESEMVLFSISYPLCEVMLIGCWVALISLMHWLCRLETRTT